MSVAEVIYTTPHEPDASSAREVLAFVLMRWDTVAPDPVERMAMDRLLGPAKEAAITRWVELRGGGRT